tara:strand:- start:370 stop:531 length:162 start_codon:yes stop_codon:yes gene_type:complete
MFEYHTRDIGADICYYRRRKGDKLWSFVNEKEYSLGGVVKENYFEGELSFLNW